MAGLANLPAMFSAMKRPWKKSNNEGEQPKRTCIADQDSAPGTSYEEDTILHVEDRDSSASVEENDPSYEEPMHQLSHQELEERRKPPGPVDISQDPSVGPTQPEITFPWKQLDYKRSFQSTWYRAYPWLEYSESQDAAFCFACRHFVLQTVHTEETFISGGFSNWKKALGATGKFAKHNVADYHMNAMVAWGSFRESEKVGSVQQIISEAYRREIRDNRHFIRTVGEVLLVTAVQNLSQRGHREDEESDNVGNLKRLLQLLSGHDKVIAKRLQGGPKNAKYTSPEVQNEILGILAQMVREEVLVEISESEQFSILVDETKDIRKTEQLSLVCRYYHDGLIKESFLSFKDAEGLDAESLSGTILTILSGYGLDYRANLVGQGYDGASVMSGAISGVAKRIKDVAPLANYVHCHAHRLNLVIVDACKSVPEASQFFALLQQLYVFISGSYVHQEWLAVQRELHPGEQPRELKRLSDTRWACRADACTVIRTRLQAVIRLLQQISGENHGDRAVAARGLIAQMDRHFVARLVLMTALLGRTKALSNMFQQDNIDLSEASDLAANLVEDLESMRTNEETFDQICEEVTEVLELCQDDLTPVRPRRALQPSRRLEGYHVVEATGQREQVTPEVEFRVNFLFPVLDRMLHELKRRFSEQNQDLMRGIDALSPSSRNFLVLDNLRAMHETYGVSQEDLKHECIK